MIKLKNILAENMRRFGTKNLSEANLEDLENTLGFDSGANRDPKTGNSMTKSLQFAKKQTYDNVRNDIASAAEDLAEALEQPKMEDLPVVQHAIQQLKRWTDRKKPAPYSVYALVAEAPALLDKMQAKSKNAWDEMRSHWGGIVDAISDEGEDEYVTEFEPSNDDMI